ncbi:hypothetical protein CBR_g30989 [Chara braunii]|uniref:Uncharacterized protein n=1 Tax=Chara braunii TaxID=69332 RepID=A0A388LE02_CHABU|nr:hypothetical protein CBR_g30989 [Chara braunii]|eukprot:GBG80528.1 hypothetical protein CBR_g30989 [Chara braunii]
MELWRSLSPSLTVMSTAHLVAMEGGGNDERGKLTTAERTAVAAAVTAVLFHCQVERMAGRMKAQIRAWRRMAGSMAVEGLNTAAICNVVLQVCCALGCVLPRVTPKWWMKRRTGGTGEDLRQCNDVLEKYFRDTLRMSPRVFGEIAETLSPFLQWRVTFYREPLQPDQIVGYALYRWALGVTYKSSTCNFGIGKASGLVAVWDVTMVLLTVYRERISWPTGVCKSFVLSLTRASPTAMCASTVLISTSTSRNGPSEDYYDWKRCFIIIVQVVVDLNLRVLEVFVV